MNVTYLAIVVVSLLSTVLGLFVGYQAYRGFRRHQSTSMRYLSVGLILLTAVTFTLSFVGSALLQYDVIDLAYRPPLILAARVLQFLGLAFIAYSLYRRP